MNDTLNPTAEQILVDEWIRQADRAKSMTGMDARNVMTTDNRATCTEKCWTPVACPDHGDRMYPFGRSAGIEAYYCCDNYADPTLNPRHLWNEHDSTRWYTDPGGWNAHEASCKECKGDDDD